MAKKKRSKRETIRGMTGDGYLDPALWSDPEAQRGEGRAEDGEAAEEQPEAEREADDPATQP